MIPSAAACARWACHRRRGQPLGVSSGLTPTSGSDRSAVISYQFHSHSRQSHEAKGRKEDSNTLITPRTRSQRQARLSQAREVKRAPRCSQTHRHGPESPTPGRGKERARNRATTSPGRRVDCGGHTVHTHAQNREEIRRPQNQRKTRQDFKKDTTHDTKIAQKSKTKKFKRRHHTPFRRLASECLPALCASDHSENRYRHSLGSGS